MQLAKDNERGREPFPLTASRPLVDYVKEGKAYSQAYPPFVLVNASAIGAAPAAPRPSSSRA